MTAAKLAQDDAHTNACAKCRVVYRPTEDQPGGITSHGTFCPACYPRYLCAINPTRERHRLEIAAVVRLFMEDT